MSFSDQPAASRTGRGAGMPGGKRPRGAVSWVEVDLRALEHNVRSFKTALAGKAELMSVVKADAYGHGVNFVAPAALRFGADWLAVVNLREGVELRGLVTEQVPVLVLGYVPPDDVEEAVAAGLSLTVYDPHVLDAAASAGERVGVPARIHLKAETGTHRQGLSLEELLPLAERAHASRWLELEGLSTHFADIEDTTDHAFALSQIASFNQAHEALTAAGCTPRYRHAACSAAAILFQQTHFDLARVGIGMYGLWPSRETLVSSRERDAEREAPFKLEPVLSWKSLLAQVKTVPTGGYVGYGRTWRATHETRVAVIPIGYHEGYARDLSARAHVLVKGRRAPVLGRVCMNMFMVDVTDVPDPQPGDEAVLIGESQADGLVERVRAEDLAGWAGTIHYEIVSRIHPSLPRVPVERG